MDNVISRLASAIATGEGFFVAGSLPSRNNNPGDLRAAPWRAQPVIRRGFWVAGSLPEGIAGLYHEIALDIARGWTLRQLITAWAPASDGNDTENYIRETARRTGLDADTPLWSYLSIDPIS
ncbi:MAG: hypothetical protein ABSD56_00610 [Bryobacteraceae bacterium]|jgi:hypothetical protein